MNKKQIIFFNTAIAIIFSIVMSFFMTWFGGGISPLESLFLNIFITSSIIGIGISLPLSFLVIPIIQKISLKLFNNKEEI